MWYYHLISKDFSCCDINSATINHQSQKISPATKECAWYEHAYTSSKIHCHMLLNDRSSTSSSTLCIHRFGVIHAVFTNLLLWCNGVMSEAEHFLNNHKRRLSALGYGNLTIGKGQRVDCWLVPGRKSTIVHLRACLNGWKKKEGEEGLRWGREVSSAAQWVLFVLNVSLLGFRRNTALLALIPPLQPLSPHFSHHHPPWQPPAWPQTALSPRPLSPKGAAITVTDTYKPRVGGFSCSSSYPADCEAGCTLTAVPFLIKGCSTIVVASGGWGDGSGWVRSTRQGFVEMVSRGSSVTTACCGGLDKEYKKCIVINF